MAIGIMGKVVGIDMEDTTSAMKIIERLKEATNSKSDSELGRNLGVSQQAIYNARNNNKVPDAWVRTASVKFNVSADWLYFGREHDRVTLQKESPKQKEEMTTTVGERIKLSRGRRSGEDFSKLLGLHLQTLYRYERDERSPDTDFIQKVSSLTGVSIEWLVAGIGPMYKGAMTRDAIEIAQPFTHVPAPAPEAPQEGQGQGETSIMLQDIKDAAGERYRQEMEAMARIKVREAELAEREAALAAREAKAARAEADAMAKSVALLQDSLVTKGRGVQDLQSLVNRYQDLLPHIPGGNPFTAAHPAQEPRNDYTPAQPPAPDKDQKNKG